jgi:mono/diheme cytochrome c family protein
MISIKFTHGLIVLLVGLALLAVMFSGCGRERISSKPPIHPNPNMDHQPKYKAQAESKFFENGAAMRPLVDGTVAEGWLREDSVYYFGMDKKGNFVKKAPVEVTMERVKRGQQRYNIYCAPCHGRVGDGRGVMNNPNYNFTERPNFHSDSVRQFDDGFIFDVITNGIRNMPSYKHQIPTDDRWSIILYIRALQRSREATIKDVPAEFREERKQ